MEHTMNSSDYLLKGTDNPLVHKIRQKMDARSSGGRKKAVTAFHRHFRAACHDSQSRDGNIRALYHCKRISAITGIHDRQPIRVGDVIELAQISKSDGEFMMSRREQEIGREYLLVKYIFKCKDEVQVHGFLLKHTWSYFHSSENMEDEKMKELSIHVDSAGDFFSLKEKLIAVDHMQVLVTHACRFSNVPACPFENNGTFLCRSIYISKFRSSKDHTQYVASELEGKPDRKFRPREGCFRNLTLDDLEQMGKYRRAHAASSATAMNGGSVYILDESSAFDEFRGTKYVRPTAYEAADICCGIGGATSAIQAASDDAVQRKQPGVKVMMALDKDEKALAVHAQNHSDVQCTTFDITDIPLSKLKYYVDLVHISFPCQAFSSANRAGLHSAGSEVNSAILLALSEVLEAFKPRVLSFEQVPPIENREDYRHWFGFVITAFREKGYSVRWSSLQFNEYGNVTTRKRLIMYAAAPGERVPEFPPPTHGPRAVRPYIYPVDKLLLVKSHHTHNEDAAPILEEDTHQHLLTVTRKAKAKSRVEQRQFSLRQRLVLQGLPPDFILPDRTQANRTDVGTMIGNMFPADAATPLFIALLDALHRADVQRFGEIVPEVIVID